MAYTKLIADVENITPLPDVPPLSATLLKQRFDKAGVDIKSYLNDTLLPELEKTENEKVNKELGKGLSTNDYTDQEKEAVAENTQARHSHSNKMLLDQTTASFTTGDKENLNQNTNARHSHTNKSVLDETTAAFTTEEKQELSENTSSRHSHNNKEILDGTTASFTVEDKEKLDDAAIVQHTHNNKSILDNITAAFTLEEKQKLYGVEANAQSNIQSDWNEVNSGSDAYIKNKPPIGNFITPDNLIAGSGMSLVKDGNNVTFNSTGGGSGGGVSQEYVDQQDGLRALKSDVLEKNNETEYTPTGDYHPATKKYVDSVGETKYSKASSATLGNLPAFGDSGELSDSGKKPGDFAEATVVNSHIEDAALHTSASEKQTWNNKADSLTLSNHTGDSNIHTSATEKQSWNQRAFPIYEVEKTEGAVTLSLYGTGSYICGELSSLTLTGSKPEIMGEDPVYYAYSIAFSSGATPTTISVPTEWVFSGDGCTDGVFTPEASTAYEMIGVWSGSALRWAVRAW